MEHARFGSRSARTVVEISDDLACLDRGGFWAVVMTFEGQVTCIRFAEVDRDPNPGPPQRPRHRQDRGGGPPRWAPLTGGWTSSLDETAYLLGVREIRERIAAGEVYQVCLCRVLSHPLPEDADLASLESLVALANPAPYPSRIFVPDAGLDVLSASPEAFLIREGGRIESRPIKGTDTSLSTMLARDYAENVMIADLVRNDLSAVCRPGRSGACGRHPDLLGGSGRHRQEVAEVRHRRRDHLGLGPRQGVGRDRAEGGSPGRTGIWESGTAGGADRARTTSRARKMRG